MTTAAYRNLLGEQLAACHKDLAELRYLRDNREEIAQEVARIAVRTCKDGTEHGWTTLTAEALERDVARGVVEILKLWEEAAK